MEYRLDGQNKKTAIFRDDIEEIIKEENIDRSRFYEFSKYKYNDIIRKFYYAFCDYTRFASAAVTLERKRLHIRSSIDVSAIAGIYAT